jgi:hypothetical protein
MKKTEYAISCRWATATLGWLTCSRGSAVPALCRPAFRTLRQRFADHRCIAPAEGYTQRCTSLSNTNHQESWSEYRPHRPQESNRRRKTCKPPGYCKTGTRSVHKTAVGNRSSAGGTITAIIHTKVLQIYTLLAVRALRSVSCPTLPQKIVLLGAPDPLTSIMALQSRLERR